MTTRLLVRTTVLPSGDRAATLLVPQSARGSEIRSALRLGTPRGLLVLNGGTEELSAETDARLRSLLGDGLARLAVDRRLTVVTGGTDAGVFRLFGEGLGRRRRAPCIGVAPAALVAWAESDIAGGKTGGANRVPLEPHHSHFVFVEGARWGDETEVMLSLVKALSATAPSLAVLANGGSVSKREVLGHVRADREVVVLVGSGRLADEIADVITGRAPADDPELAEIAAGEITLFDQKAPASALVKHVSDRLGPRRRPSVRSVAVFSGLPQPHWKPGPEYPLVSEPMLARAPALEAEVDLLEHELVPRFRNLDQESLHTQNTFRLGQLALILGGAVATMLGAVQAALGAGVVGLAVAEALLAGVLAGATVFIRGRNAQRDYFTSRLRAERLRAEYFLVLAHAGDYAGIDDDELLRRLRRRIRAIEAQERP
ncbi:MAG: DUF4231 domain-containing protein [Gaiellaceae bacterium]